MSRTALLTTVGVALAMAGCTTTLTVSPVDPARPETAVGLPYPLYFTQYELVITRQVTGCGAELKSTVKAEIRSTSAAPDPRASYVLRSQDFASPMKISDVSLQYGPGGAVTGLNATAEDRTGQVVGNVVGTAVKVVKIAAGAGGAGGVEVCRPETLKAVTQDLKPATEAVKAATKLVESRTKALKAVQDKAAAMGGNVDDATRTALSAAYDALLAANEDLAAKQKVLEAVLKVVTDVQVVRWPENGEARTATFGLPPAVLNRWAQDLDDNEVANPRAQFDVVVELRVAGNAPDGRSVGYGAMAPAPAAVDTRLGVPIRQPAKGMLLVCAGGPCEEGGERIAFQWGDIQQLGPVYYLPCVSRPFSSISCSFTAGEDGRLKSIGQASKTATAEGLTGAIGATVGAVGEAQTARQGAETARLKAATEAAKAQKDYDDAIAALNPSTNASELAALNANTELLKARKAELDAKAALEAARTGDSAP